MHLLNCLAAAISKLQMRTKRKYSKKRSQYNNTMEIEFSVRLDHQRYENEHKRDHKAILFN